MNDYNDYLFLLEPSDVVKKQVEHCKLKASEYIGTYPGVKGTAHLSICMLERQKPHIINSFIESIKNKINSMPPVTLQVNGFEYFVHGEDRMTIYAAIKPTFKSDNWFALLRKQLNTKKLITPHITVTKHITTDDFYKLWRELRLVPYKESFTVDKLTILVKETFKPNAKYDIYERLYFKNELKY
ncbi:2'-5' RNA ligase family protein [Mucilaginibacter terrae]|uniref:2'-5' RNA ligase n=1 Tax=Mucilaginibacter terrae TaxID=1955052 RepID=A0ABU3GP36_9SPHI|nr:2'-5' RNA ligase family protein [Mucilaginibacter terrae]MDT3401544.1 2'-5' RNA ligase [Mucilaginibacter terrae]